MSLESGPPSDPVTRHALFCRFQKRGEDAQFAANTLESVVNSARAAVDGSQLQIPGRLASDVALFRSLLGRELADSMLYGLSIDPATATVTDVTRWQNRIPGGAFPVVEQLAVYRRCLHTMISWSDAGGSPN